MRRGYCDTVGDGYFFFALICPIHRGDGRSRKASVSLESNVYQWFDANCQSDGDLIEL